MSSQRLHGMDFCRAMFMSLGLFFHCGLIYGTGHDWRVVSSETHILLALFSNFIHHFRMEAFYLVSGFFYLLVYRKKIDGFLSERVSRVLIPMLVVGLTLNILMNGLSYNFSFEWGGAYFNDGKWLGHLWFLGNLVVYFVLAKPICERLLDQQGDEKPRSLKLIMIAMLILAVTGQIIANHLEWKTVIFINFGYLVYYFAYFLMGVAAYQEKEEFIRMIKLKHFPLFLGTYAVIQVIIKSNVDMSTIMLELLKLVSHFPLMLAAFSILYAIGNKEHKVIRFFSDASYTIYLLHQPLIIIFYVFIFEHIELGAVTEYFMLLALVFMVSSFIHMQFISRFSLLRFLFNGVLDRNKIDYQRINA